LCNETVAESGLLGTVVLALAFYMLMARGRGGGEGAANWGSYYLFWMVAPAVLAAVSRHPAALILLAVGVLARRWLPDPFLFLRYRGRIRSLEVDVGTNPGNVTARRQLAVIWLELRRPARAMPLLEQALSRDPGSNELLFFRGVAQLRLKQWEPALASFIAVVHQDASFRYGEAYLRAADALLALRRWEDAEDALDRHLQINHSSIEGLFKRVAICKARRDAPGLARARQELRDAWHTLPSFQRRNQLGWYLRSLVAG
jgi:tetratricopeptide (TPR) repeat protein